MELIIRKYALAILVLLALGLRLLSISFNSLYPDEFSTIIESRNLTDCFNSDTQPPLFFIFLHFWSIVFGDTVTVLRLPSVLAGTLAVVISYLLFRLWFNPKIALLVSFLSAVSAYQIFFSQEIRGYALLGLFSLLTIYFEEKYVISQKYIDLLGVISSTALVLYSSYIGLFSILTVNLLFILNYYYHKNLSLNRWIVSQIVAITLALPIILRSFWKFQWIKENNWLSPAPLRDAMLWPGEYFGYSNFIISVAIIIITVYGILISYKRNYYPLSVAKVVIWIFIQYVLIIVLTYTLFPIAYGSRHVIQSSYAFYGATVLWVVHFQKKYLTYITVILFVSIVSLISFMYNITPSKTEWKRAAEIINNASTINDIAIVPDWDWMWESFNYYYNKSNLAKIEIKENNWNDKISERELSMVTKRVDALIALKNPKTVYFIVRDDLTFLADTVNRRLNDHFHNKSDIKIDSGREIISSLGYYYPINIYVYSYRMDANNLD